MFDAILFFPDDHGCEIVRQHLLGVDELVELFDDIVHDLARGAFGCGRDRLFHSVLAENIPLAVGCFDEAVRINEQKIAGTTLAGS